MMFNRDSMALNKGIKAQLLPLCFRVYLREAQEKKEFPYIVFDARPIGEYRAVVELDLWGVRGSEFALQKLADDIEEHLHGSVLSAPQYLANPLSNNDQKWVPDENKDILHINMSFDCIYHN